MLWPDRLRPTFSLWKSRCGCGKLIATFRFLCYNVYANVQLLAPARQCIEGPFSGAAAALNLEYTLPNVSQSVVITRMEGRTPVPEKEKVRSFAGHQSTMVLFLSAGLLKELEAELLAGGYAPETPAAIVYKATWPEEECHICTVGTLADTAAAHQITKTALIIVGDVVRCRHYSRSRLYDPTFTTEYRKGSQ